MTACPDDDQYRPCLTTNVVTGTPDVCEGAENLSDESERTEPMNECDVDNAELKRGISLI